MPICSYIVFPQDGQLEPLKHRLAALDSCHVEGACNRDLLLLLTDTASPAEEEALQERLKGLEQVQCMVLTFGDIAVPAAGVA